MFLSSPQNPRIKALKKLEKATERREQGLFLIEGMRELCLADQSGYQIMQLLICEDMLVSDERYNLEQCKLAGTEIIHLSREAYEALAYRGGTEGVVATARPKVHHLESLVLPEQPLTLIVDGVEKPGNLGAMLRTCDAAAVDAVIVCDTKTDIYNPNVVRSSIGTVFTNQIAVAGTEQVIAFLALKGITIFAADPGASLKYHEADFCQSVAIVVGDEATGLSQNWKLHAGCLGIPMRGRIDSLNVSVSAAILLYEALRQRSS